MWITNTPTFLFFKIGRSDFQILLSISKSFISGVFCARVHLRRCTDHTFLHSPETINLSYSAEAAGRDWLPPLKIAAVSDGGFVILFKSPCVYWCCMPSLQHQSLKELDTLPAVPVKLLFVDSVGEPMCLNPTLNSSIGKHCFGFLRLDKNVRTQKSKFQFSIW